MFLKVGLQEGYSHYFSSNERGNEGREKKYNRTQCCRTRILGKKNSLKINALPENFPELSTVQMFSTAKNRMEHGDVGWWKEQILNADVDRNGTLSFNEFME